MLIRYFLKHSWEISLKWSCNIYNVFMKYLMVYKEKNTLSYNYSEIPHEIKHPFMECSRRFIHELIEWLRLEWDLWRQSRSRLLLRHLARTKFIWFWNITKSGSSATFPAICVRGHHPHSEKGFLDVQMFLWPLPLVLLQDTAEKNLFHPPLTLLVVIYVNWDLPNEPFLL